MRIRRAIALFLFGVAVCGITIFGLSQNPQMFANLSYAAEAGKALAAKEQLSVAGDLSQAFQHIADIMKPSVVSVSSKKKVRAAGDRANPFSGLPPQLRQFFGDEMFERFERFEGFENRLPREGWLRRGMGTGVVLSQDGYIVTNYHVIAGSDQVTVTLSNDKQHEATVVGTDQKSDLAVLKIDASGLVPAELGDSETLRVGEWVLAMGSPFGLTQTVTAGIVSATGRQNVGVADYEDFIQTDAAINPGNSGGPLVNLQGEVVGINTAIASRSGGYMGVGFAIPSSMVKQITESIIDKGQVERGWLGATIQNVTEDLAKSFDYPESGGVLIGDVLPDSPAESAGLQSGDIVRSYRGEEMTTASELRNAVAATSPGTSASLRVFRDGEWVELEVKVGKLDESKIAAGTGQSQSRGFSELGMSTRSLTPELAERMELDPEKTGIVVTGVEPGSLAAEAGLRPGDLIVSANGEPLEDVEQFREQLASLEDDRGLRLLVEREGFRRFAILRKQ